MVGLPQDQRHLLQGAPLWRTPLVPLPVALLYPGRRLPIHLRGASNINLVNTARRGDGLVSIATIQPERPRSRGMDDPIFDIVGVGRVVNSITFPDAVQFTVEGISRGRLITEEAADDFRVGLVTPLTEGGEQEDIGKELASLLREVGDLRLLNSRKSGDLSPGQVADLINTYLPLPVIRRQEVFEILDVASRIRHVRRMLRESRPGVSGLYNGKVFPS